MTYEPNGPPFRLYLHATAEQYDEYRRMDDGLDPASTLGLALATAVPPRDLLTAIATALDDFDLARLASAVREARDGNDWTNWP